MNAEGVRVERCDTTVVFITVGGRALVNTPTKKTSPYIKNCLLCAGIA